MRRVSREDARFLSAGTAYGKSGYLLSRFTKGYFNGAGLTTCEVYLIKAECLARQVTGNDDFSAAMDVLNKVRKTRILPEIYQPCRLQL